MHVCLVNMKMVDCFLFRTVWRFVLIVIIIFFNNFIDPRNINDSVSFGGHDITTLQSCYQHI